MPPPLYRNAQAGAQAAERAVAEPDFAAMRARDVASDRQAKAGAAMVLVARLVEAEERPEYVLAALGGHARPIVVDLHGDEAAFAAGRNLRPPPIALGVADEIGEAALDRQRPHRDLEIAVGGKRHRRAVALRAEPQFLQQFAEIGRR